MRGSSVCFMGLSAVGLRCSTVAYDSLPFTHIGLWETGLNRWAQRSITPGMDSGELRAIASAVCLAREVDRQVDGRYDAVSKLACGWP